MKWIVTSILVCGVVLIIIAGSSYFNSGEIVMTQPVSSTAASSGQVELTPEMNSLRVLLKTKYRSITRSSRANFYTYDVELTSPEGIAVLTKRNEHVVQRQSEDIQANERKVTKRQNHNIGKIDVEALGLYRWQASIKGKQSKIESAEIIIRANVATKFPKKLWIGIALILIGITIGILFRGK